VQPRGEEGLPPCFGEFSLGDDRHLFDGLETASLEPLTYALFGSADRADEGPHGRPSRSHVVGLSSAQTRDGGNATCIRPAMEHPSSGGDSKRARMKPEVILFLPCTDVGSTVADGY
jgi:hypothetical protein